VLCEAGSRELLRAEKLRREPTACLRNVSNERALHHLTSLWCIVKIVFVRVAGIETGKAWIMPPVAHCAKYNLESGFPISATAATIFAPASLVRLSSNELGFFAASNFD